MNQTDLSEFYCYFFFKAFKKRKTITEKEQKHIQSFLKLINKEYGESVGKEWLFEYLSFQFNKYSTANTKMALQLSWIYGKKGLENYRNRNEESEYFNIIFREKNGINKRIINENNDIILSKDYFNGERKRFTSDKDKQLIHCSDMDLFDENSEVCFICQNKFYCKLINDEES